MTDSDLLDLLRRARSTSRRQTAEPTPECLADDTAAALAEGRLDGAARTAALAHMAHCARCVSVVASLARAFADPKVAREIAAAEGRSRLRLYHIALPAAVVAALLLLVALPRRTPEGLALHRAPTITATAAPVPMSPMGVVAEPGPLRWASVAGAQRYRVTLFDATSRVLYERVLSDTEVVLPDSIHLMAGRPYLWKVDARTGWDRWAASSLVEFRVAGRPH